MSMHQEGSKKLSLEKAIDNLGVKRLIRFQDYTFKLACLIRESDRRPLQAGWWRGKQVSLIAVDDDGNFFLRHPGGQIIYLDQLNKLEVIVAKSESDFLKMLELDV